MADQLEPSSATSTCECGNAWYELREESIRFFDGNGLQESVPSPPAVLLREDGTVCGYSGIPRCMDCGSRHPSVPDMGFLMGPAHLDDQEADDA